MKESSDKDSKKKTITEIEKPINIDNLDYLYDNSKMLTEIVDILSNIYATKKNGIIENMLLYLVSTKDKKHEKFSLIYLEKIMNL